MTALEKKIANRLQLCTFLPGTFDKRFVKQLSNWKERDMTEKGRAMMIKLFDKYRRQIRDYNSITLELKEEAQKKALADYRWDFWMNHGAY